MDTNGKHVHVVACTKKGIISQIRCLPLPIPNGKFEDAIKPVIQGCNISDGCIQSLLGSILKNIAEFEFNNYIKVNGNNLHNDLINAIRKDLHRDWKCEDYLTKTRKKRSDTQYSPPFAPDLWFKRDKHNVIVEVEFGSFYKDLVEAIYFHSSLPIGEIDDHHQLDAIVLILPDGDEYDESRNIVSEGFKLFSKKANQRASYHSLRGWLLRKVRGKIPRKCLIELIWGALDAPPPLIAIGLSKSLQEKKPL